MSNTVGHGFVNGALATVVENLNKSHPLASMSCNSRKNQLQSPVLSSKFHGDQLNVHYKSLRKARRKGAFATTAALAPSPGSENAKKSKFEEKSEVQVIVTSPRSVTNVLIQITDIDRPLLLHWGAIQDKEKNWSIPLRRPDGTKVYKNKALRTPFKKAESNLLVNLEVDDPRIEAIEFLMFDERENRWFKDNGQNFRVQLPKKDKAVSQLSIPPYVSVPEELVQIQASLNWETNGKQLYTLEQEKLEYEAARMELLEELAKGTSVEELWDRLKKKKKEMPPKDALSVDKKIPDGLVKTQAYIRWEKAGKPNYSQDEQLRELEEARKELQLELDKGVTVDEIRKKVTKGDVQAKVVIKPFVPERIQRKDRDVTQLLNKPEPGFRSILIEQGTLTALETWSIDKEGQDGVIIINKKLFKTGDHRVLVLVTNRGGKTKVHVATDTSAPLTLHWGLSKGSGEWIKPSPGALPPNSVLVDKACQTHFMKSSKDPLNQVQSVEIDVDEGDYVGLPFVLLSDGQWIKNYEADFYVELRSRPRKTRKDPGDGKGTAKALLDKIAELENEAARSFMHRFKIAADLIEEGRDPDGLDLVGILVWMRFMATRQLTWNKNYNVKPREISKAQDRLTDLLQNLYMDFPRYREIVRIIMATVGRGGEGDVGQRIRDEILVIQRKNNCKGGMMEEWHQKLHNNTSPDDVVICQALIDYIRSYFDVDAYWNTLKSNGITRERLLSYDRPIRSEPSFRKDQKEGLLCDLENYLRTLKAVHSGTDLRSAIATCLGYRLEGQGFMVGVQRNPVPGLPSGFPELLHFIMQHVEDKNIEPLLEGLLEARSQLQPLLNKPHDRLKDLIFLDISLDSTVRTAIERGYEELNSSGPEKIIKYITLVLENLALSSVENEELIYCLKGWDQALNMIRDKNDGWALYAKSVLDRTHLALADIAEGYQKLLQPSADYLGSLLGIEEKAVNTFTEEIIRGGSAASLSTLINRLDPILRQAANLGSWQVISPGDASGYVAVVEDLLSVQNNTYEVPTILVVTNVKGEEEIPDGVVAVLTPGTPDVLSHVSVRARNNKVCFATCFDPNILADLQAKKGKPLTLKVMSTNVKYRETDESLTKKQSTVPAVSVKKPTNRIADKYAISKEEFNSETVGKKSLNILDLTNKKLPGIEIPKFVAIPFGVFDKVVQEEKNKDVNTKFQSLKNNLSKKQIDVLPEIRKSVLQLQLPDELMNELKGKMKKEGMQLPGDEDKEQWNRAWMAIKKVWASKWNERAYISFSKAKFTDENSNEALPHDDLFMAVLVQEMIDPDYAFVIHTTNPFSKDSSEIYAEVVLGLGETLVGAYPGRALSFVCSKKNLDSPKVLGYPSKPTKLFMKKETLIFRSDSNVEDLQNYAGAGLYDSVPLDDPEKVVVDYSKDGLIVDWKYRNSILSSIAKAGEKIEEALGGSAQDIEGVVKDGKIYVVQTRSQV